MESTQWTDTFTKDDYKALVKSMFDGTVKVSDDTSAMARTQHHRKRIRQHYVTIGSHRRERNSFIDSVHQVYGSMNPGRAGESLSGFLCLFCSFPVSLSHFCLFFALNKCA